MKEPGSKLRNLDTLNEYRILSGPVIDNWGGWRGDDTCGAFRITYRPKGKALSKLLRVIVSGAEGWDHVSVSLHDRCPTWDEMEYIKRLFFEDDAVCMQLHVAVSNHISHHPYCLHIWHPHADNIPLPPSIFVGPPPAKD